MKIAKEHADTVLELAYLVTAADGRLGDDELEAYRDVVASVRDVQTVSQSDLDALLDRFAGNVEHEEIAERVRELSPKLPAELRDETFKIAVRLSLADLDRSREEEALTDVMLEALGLTPERADELTAEVYAAFDAGADE